jgi:hypothetical protein
VLRGGTCKFLWLGDNGVTLSKVKQHTKILTWYQSLFPLEKSNHWKEYRQFVLFSISLSTHKIHQEGHLRRVHRFPH